MNRAEWAECYGRIRSAWHVAWSLEEIGEYYQALKGLDATHVNEAITELVRATTYPPTIASLRWTAHRHMETRRPDVFEIKGEIAPPNSFQQAAVAWFRMRQAEIRDSDATEEEKLKGYGQLVQRAYDMFGYKDDLFIGSDGDTLP